ncbi:MAG: uracil-DNA glycosylase family protein [Myxococcales bacterium]
MENEIREELAAAVAELRAYLSWAGEGGRAMVALSPTANPTATANPTPIATTTPTSVPKLPILSLDEVRAQLGECVRCKLHKGRHTIVFGVGNADARLMFVGEAPGEDEDLKGEPFVGKAGQLLTKMIEAMGLRREDVYICNTVKCRPPNNRNPEPDELTACEPFLKGQLASVRPEVIVTLGKFAAQALLRDQTPITRLRGQWREYEGIPVMPTFHPAYLLRSPQEKVKVWEDLQSVMKKLGMERTR